MQLPENVNPDLFEPFDRFVEIDIMGRVVKVPDNNTVLRCFQYLSSYTISYGKFCWNNDCGNCECTVLLPGKTEPVQKRTCCTKVREGMKIVATSKWVRLRF